MITIQFENMDDRGMKMSICTSFQYGSGMLLNNADCKETRSRAEEIVLHDLMYSF